MSQQEIVRIYAKRVVAIAFPTSPEMARRATELGRPLTIDDVVAMAITNLKSPDFTPLMKQFAKEMKK